MQIAHLHPHSEIYGPGTRFVIWTQGCSIHCPGCWNTAFWPFGLGKSMTADEIMKQILLQEATIEGVTILGGEPFDQASELRALVDVLRPTGLSLMLYSGYEWQELVAAGHMGILQQADIVITGRYEHRLRDTSLRWRGSRNQVLHFLSPRYAHLELTEAREIEIVWDADGRQHTYGYPEAWVL
jgi:anaerobic ribonucleoside-triphosphate reductase activating protein